MISRNLFLEYLGMLITTAATLDEYGNFLDRNAVIDFINNLKKMNIEDTTEEEKIRLHERLDNIIEKFQQPSIGMK